jgi:hypothetical protein
VITLAEFLAPPTEAQWADALARGWSGPDGSSASTDHICGVRIGITTRDWAFHRLPASLHDWRYLLGRTLRLDDTFRAAADAAYRDDCIATCRAALTRRRDLPLLALAIGRAHARYVGLRVGAWLAWTDKQRALRARWCDDGGGLCSTEQG